MRRLLPNLTEHRSLQLGLIGDDIGRSRAPRFHELAGERSQINVTYTLHDLADSDEAFDTLFDRLVSADYAGFNVTHPYKERAPLRVSVADPLVAAMGAVNTVVVGVDGVLSGFNTDYSGFRYAWTQRFAERRPGSVALIGAGGAGRAIAFALVALGATEIRILDVDAQRCRRLEADLKPVAGDTRLRCVSDVQHAIAGCEGLVNATPVGMGGTDELPVPGMALDGLRWVFDAVYTPERTALIKVAQRKGADVLTGFGLFLGQGIDAFAHFSGQPLSGADIRYIETTIRNDIARTEA